MKNRPLKSTEIEAKRLSEISPGKEYFLSHYDKPDSDFARKLTAMGFVEGTAMKLADTGRRDPLVFCLRNVRIALRRRDADSVYVR